MCEIPRFTPSRLLMLWPADCIYNPHFFLPLDLGALGRCFAFELDSASSALSSCSIAFAAIFSCRALSSSAFLASSSFRFSAFALSFFSLSFREPATITAAAGNPRGLGASWALRKAPVRGSGGPRGPGNPEEPQEAPRPLGSQ